MMRPLLALLSLGTFAAEAQDGRSTAVSAELGGMSWLGGAVVAERTVGGPFRARGIRVRRGPERHPAGALHTARGRVRRWPGLVPAGGRRRARDHSGLLGRLLAHPVSLRRVPIRI